MNRRTICVKDMTEKHFKEGSCSQILAITMMLVGQAWFHGVSAVKSLKIVSGSFADHRMHHTLIAGNVTSILRSLIRNSNMDSNQWKWMMDYCKRKGIPPAQDWAWEKAKRAYRERII